MGQAREDEGHAVHDTGRRVRLTSQRASESDIVDVEIGGDFCPYVPCLLVYRDGDPARFGDYRIYVLGSGVQQVVRSTDGGVACEGDFGGGREDVDGSFPGFGVFWGWEVQE